MIGHTLTIYVTDEQQQRLEAIARMRAEQMGATYTATDALELILRPGIAHVINERLPMWEEYYRAANLH